MPRNIRIDSLPSNRRIASQDCRCCIERRIRCDRSIPTCLKCTSRGLKCSGFGPVNVRWNRGIASRGKFAGKPTPAPQESTCKTHDASSNASPSPSHQNKTTRNPSSGPLIARGDANDNSTILNPQPTLDARLVNSCSSAALFGSLLRHFHAQVVPRLTWIDPPESPWRQMVRYNTQHPTCLHLSIGSLAAAHLSIASTGPDSHKARFRQVHQQLHDAALRGLNQRMRKELHTEATASNATPSSSSIQEILASMVALCYSEAFIPGSRNWALHLRACRTVLDLQRLRDGSGQPSDALQRFLLKEVADLETLSNISVFKQDMSTSYEPPLQTIYEGSFWAFTGLVYEITMGERQRYRELQRHRTVPAVNLAGWRARAERAHEILSTINPFPSDQESKQRTFQAVLRSHFYASLIYSYQAFASVDELAKLVGTTLDPLLEEMYSVITGPTQALSHDLFFPLFIAGTECCGSKERQSMVERLYLASLSTTGLWFNHTALQFLQVFWASAIGETECWIQFARENETRLGTFIAF